MNKPLVFGGILVLAGAAYFLLKKSPAKTTQKGAAPQVSTGASPTYGGNNSRGVSPSQGLPNMSAPTPRSTDVLGNSLISLGLTGATDALNSLFNSNNPSSPSLNDF